MVTGLEVSSRLMVWCRRMSGNSRAVSAVTEVLGTRPKIREILELRGKNLSRKTVYCSLYVWGYASV